MLLKLVKKHKSILLFLIIFLLLLPVSLSINYWQNDEWAYYFNVQQLLEGSLKLHPLTAPTFYSTGILAAIFASIFGFHNIPVLTLAVSIISIFFLYKIILKDSNNKELSSIFTAILLFSTPLFAFNMWGFMTDNYFLLYLILSIFFLNKSKDVKVYLLLGVVTIIFGYFTRQLALILPLSYSLWFFINKQFKKSLILFITLTAITIYHFYFFPKTGEMIETKFATENLTYFRYIFSLFWAIGITITMYLFPIIVPRIYYFYIKQSKINKIKFFVVFLSIISFSNIYFNNIGWINEDIFYFKYTVGTKGFFTENLHGTKSNFMFGNYIYKILDFVSKAVFTLFITFLLFYKNKKELFINKYIFLLTTYFGLLLISVKIYDRYLLPMLLFSILYLVSLKFLDYLNIYFLVSWILLIILYSYNYSQDYIRTNNYVYNKAETLYLTEKLEPQQITATDLWRYKYPNTSKPKIYKFTYDNPNLQNYSTDFELIDKKVIDYPLNFWLKKNVIYLYRKIDIN